MAYYGYVRVSTEEQGADDRSSLEIQERRIQGLALAEGVTIDRMFREPGISGAIPLVRRPAGKEMLDALRPGDTVVAMKLDRMFRSAHDALDTAKFMSEEKKAWLILLDLGTTPVNQTGIAKVFFTMLAAFAEFERYAIKERQRLGQTGKRAKGGHIGGSAPFGYRVEGRGRTAILVPDEAQQAAIAVMREMREAKVPYREISECLSARHGMQVSHVTVRAVLNRVEAACTSA